MSLFKKSLFFTIRLEMKKHKKEETMNPSAERVQFFSVFWSNGGKREATVKWESRLKEGKKKRKNTAAPMYTKIEKPRKTF